MYSALETALRMNGSAPTNKPISHPRLWLLAVLVGVIAGLGAVIFRGLIGTVLS
jgi:hypothetical protein